MKKILLFAIFIVTTFSLKAQYSPENSLYSNYIRFRDYYANGTFVKADIEAKKFIKGIGLMNEYLLGSFSGRTGLMDSCMTEFNTLYGKTHDAPSITISALSYLEIDSFSFDGGTTWVHDIITADSVNALIEAAGIDSVIVIALIDSLSIDSTFLNTHLSTFRDSLDVTADVKDSVLNWINDSILQFYGARDSSWVRTDHDTLYVGDNKMYSESDLLYFYPTGTSGEPVIIDMHSFGGGNYYTKIRVPLIHLVPLDLTPASVSEGMIMFDNSENMIKYYNGSYWSTVDTTGGTGTTTGDSSWTSASVDTLNFNDYDIRLVAGSQKLSVETLTGTGNTVIAPTEILSDRTAGVRIITGADPTSTSPNMLPDRADANTGYSWVSADKLGLVAGGQSVATFEYAGTKKTTDLKDSLIVTGIHATRLDVDSIKTANGYHKYIASFSTAPSDSSIYCTTPAGGNFLVPLTSITEAAQDSAAVSASEKYVKVFDSTGTKFDYYSLEPDTVQTISDSTVSVNVINTSLIKVADSEACAIFGFVGGELGDHVALVNTTANNLILKDNSTGTQKILTGSGSDVTITGIGGAEFWFDGTYWYITGLNQ